MKRLIPIIAVAALSGSAVEAAAATLKLSRPCFSEGTGGRLRGTGFEPNATVRISGAASASVNTDANGAFNVGYRPARLPEGVHERRYRLAAADDVGNSTATFYRVAAIYGDFQPFGGNPDTARGRFRVFGFVGRRTIYVHYVRNDRHVRTYSLGRGAGSCNSVTTARRKLFPFKASDGRWKLQFDPRARYSPRTRPHAFLKFTVRTVPAR